MPKLYLRTAYNNSWRHFRKAGKSYLVLCISASREGNVTLSYDRYGSYYLRSRFLYGDIYLKCILIDQIWIYSLRVTTFT